MTERTSLPLAPTGTAAPEPPAEDGHRRAPAGEAPPAAPAAVPMLQVEHVSVELGSGAARTRILNDVCLPIERGRTVGLVGESGSGKSTLAKTIIGALPPTSGAVFFDGQSTTGLRGAGLRAWRRRVQLIPQDPYSSLNPRRTIGQTLAEAIDPVRGRPARHAAEIAGWLERVALPADAALRYPHEFSGGQRQRIAIARALAVRPELVIADEITSALDLTTQAEILNLLGELRRDLGLTMLFISHNLAVVRHVSDQVAVLYHGDLVESGDADRVYAAPSHPYTRRLLDSVPGGPGFDIDGSHLAAAASGGGQGGRAR